MSADRLPFDENFLKEKLRSDPTTWETRRQLAHGLYDKQEYEEAAEIIWTSEQIPSTDLDLAFAARVLSKAQPRRAIRLLTAVLELNQGKAVQNMAMANALLHHGMVLQAARFYGAALEADPTLVNPDLEHFILWSDDECTMWGLFEKNRPKLGQLPWMLRDPKEALRLTSRVSLHTTPIYVPDLPSVAGEALKHDLYQQEATHNAKITPPPAVTIPIDRVDPKDRLFDAEYGATVVRSAAPDAPVPPLEVAPVIPVVSVAPVAPVAPAAPSSSGFPASVVFPGSARAVTPATAFTPEAPLPPVVPAAPAASEAPLPLVVPAAPAASEAPLPLPSAVPAAPAASEAPLPSVAPVASEAPLPPAAVVAPLPAIAPAPAIAPLPPIAPAPPEKEGFPSSVVFPSSEKVPLVSNITPEDIKRKEAALAALPISQSSVPTQVLRVKWSTSPSISAKQITASTPAPTLPPASPFMAAPPEAPAANLAPPAPPAVAIPEAVFAPAPPAPPIPVAAPLAPAPPIPVATLVTNEPASVEIQGSGFVPAFTEAPPLVPTGAPTRALLPSGTPPPVATGAPTRALLPSGTPTGVATGASRLLPSGAPPVAGAPRRLLVTPPLNTPKPPGE